MQPNQQPPAPTQSRAQIYIENLDQGISEDYLYRKFKEVGEIQSLKIAKDKTTQKSKGQAYITFANQDSVDEAKKRFNNAVFIKNPIRVKSYFNYHTADKKANVFINNLPEDADTLELEQEFSRFGNVLSLDIHRDNQGKPLNYGYVQFEKKEDVDKLMVGGPIIHKGKVLKLDQFKAQTERKTESSAIYLRAFARPLQQEEVSQDKYLRALEHAWQLIVKSSFEKEGFEVSDCFVKMDTVNRQPWAMIRFSTPEQAKVNLDICEKTRTHPCTKSSAQRALELLKKAGPPANSDGTLQFKVEEVEGFFKELINSHDDPFKGESENFFFNQVYSKHLNPDDRLILIQNVRDEITKEDMMQFLSQFGKVIRLTIRGTKNARFQVKQCYVHYQTLEDSKRARSEVYDETNQKIVEQRKKVFKEGHVMMNILLSKAVRKEYKEIKKQQGTSIFQSPYGRSLLQPQFPQTMPPPMPYQPYNMRPPGPPMPGRGPYPNNRPVMPPGPRQFPPGGQRPQFAGGMRPPYGQYPPNQQYPPRQQQQQFPFQGGYPQQQPNTLPQFPNIAPQQQQQQQQNLGKFSNYDQIKQNMNEFTQLPNSEQRVQLGNLLFVRIGTLTDQKQYLTKIVGMLIDETQFDIGEILNFFEDQAELQGRVSEAIDLLNEKQENSQP